MLAKVWLFFEKKHDFYKNKKDLPNRMDSVNLIFY